ncbi:hypothetical protein [Tunturiibacter gelidoferens]|nr:hypothetical protein [Edaphobacter lichenicola]MBB5341373.1 hypothetical protein [Edaphobacter lichenicola]
MRHSRTATTTDVYMQEIPESVQPTVNSINKELRMLSTKMAGKSRSHSPMLFSSEGSRSSVALRQ